MDMKKIFYSIFFTAFCIIIAAACDSENEKEPEPPVDPVNPVEPIDTVVNDSVDADSFGIGPFVPYTGPIEPLSKEIRPTLTEGKRWLSVRIRFPHIPPSSSMVDFGKYWYFSNLIQGDTITIGKKAKIMHWRYGKDGVLPDYTDPYVEHELYCEDNEIVYKILQYGKDYKCEIDFKVDASGYENINGYHIISKGTIVLMGKTRRVLKIWINNRSRHPYDYWVEGIGSLFGYSVDHKIAHTTEQYMNPLLLQCYDGDELIYDYREFKPELYKEIEVFTDIDK